MGYLIGGYIAGWFIAAMIIRLRAGVGIMRRLRVFGPQGFGLGWTFSSGVKAMFWPLTLGYWLATGRPEPRVVFNEKARQRASTERVAS